MEGLKGFLASPYVLMDGSITWFAEKRIRGRLSLVGDRFFATQAESDGATQAKREDQWKLLENVSEQFFPDTNANV